ncbi:MAG: cobalamin-dependent protein [Planctomycetota bacterium]|nr:cobalamin-dependent protein [Planctomycetota bacterium]
MTNDALHRRHLAELVRAAKDDVAELVVARMESEHPKRWAALTAGARAHARTDITYHVEFLAGSLELGEPHLFEDYARWASRVLSARGLDLGGLRTSLEHAGAALRDRLGATGTRDLDATLAQGIACIAEPPESAATADEDALALTRSLFLQAILRGERQAAHNVVMEARDRGHAVIDLYVDVFQEALYEVGRLWERNEIPVASEHMATATAQFVLTQMYDHLPRSSERRGRAIVTGVQGEQHQVGAYMIADLLESDGWSVRFLGTNMPHAGILTAIEEHEPELVGISVTMLGSLPSVRDLIDSIRRDHDVRIVVGGGAFRASTDGWRMVGADGYAPDLRSAAEVVRRLASA